MGIDSPPADAHTTPDDPTGVNRVPRSLLALLLCLLAALPQQVCACAADHPGHATPDSSDRHDDSDQPDEQPAGGHDHEHDGDPSDRECPCSCHATPREAYTAPRAADDLLPDLQSTFAVGFVEPFTHAPPLLPTAPRTEPPPGRLHTSLPLFLSVCRLLN